MFLMVDLEPVGLTEQEALDYFFEALNFTILMKRFEEVLEQKGFLQEDKE